MKYVQAQTGSFIPCKFASLRLCDQLLTRICNEDDLETNTSTFMMEMREVSNILHNVTENSLVIIDELGRGTSLEDGIGIAMAVAESLLQVNASPYQMYSSIYSNLKCSALHSLLLISLNWPRPYPTTIMS